jgi:hypothetical protein
MLKLSTASQIHSLTYLSSGPIGFCYLNTYPIKNMKLIVIQRPKLHPVILFSNLFNLYSNIEDRLCGLVARVPGYRSRGPGSVPGATRFSEK